MNSLSYLGISMTKRDCPLFCINFFNVTTEVLKTVPGDNFGDQQ